MSWQLGAFGLLGLALAVGFGWYERSRPDARIVALVATLAAFAALGRIAFAAIPNVKPTTDIVLISGYALGGAPGFAVGAVAALASNFFFGQGPWTPWQMAGWGATGILGAGLALATGRRIGRWPLAIACGAVGFAFTAFQDLGDWITYSDHSLVQLGVYVGRGIGFDLVHAVSCVVFALAFGPALIRSIERFTARLQVRWLPAAATLAALTVALAIAAPLALAASTPKDYLLAAQNRDGGFGPAPGQASSQLYTGWAALGLEAAGINPKDVSHGGTSLLDYIASGIASDTDPGSLERTILVVHAAGDSPSAFGGHNLLAQLEQQIHADGSVNEQVNWTAFLILALRAAGAGAPARSVIWLEHQQNRDGGFSFATRGGTSDVDDTGAALEAIAPGSGRMRARALRFIRQQQNRDGGFPSLLGANSNAQSTAWAIQGLLAAGVDPAALHRPGSPSPEQYLQALTAPDGHVRYSRATDQTPVWVSAQALMALEAKVLPLAPVPARTERRKAPRRVHAAHRHRPRRRPAAAPQRLSPEPPSPMLEQLASDAGVLAAVVLAPVGLG